MVIKILKREEIDSNKWDAAIANSSEGTIYALSWYLDIVSPGWSAITDNSDTYSTLIPLPGKTKFFFLKLLLQPYFCQQLGIFSNETGIDRTSFLTEAIKIIKRKYHISEYHFNSGNNHSLFLIPGLQKHLKERTNYLLNLSSNYESLRKNYSENHKRNLKKALKNRYDIDQTGIPGNLISLFKKTKGKEISQVKETDYQKLEQIITVAHEHNLMEGFYLKESTGEIIAGACFILFKNRILYLLGASSEKGKQTGAMSFLMDRVIEKYSGTGKTLDFEGSNIPSLARFYKGFGAEYSPYFSFNDNKLKNLF